MYKLSQYFLEYVTLGGKRIEFNMMHLLCSKCDKSWLFEAWRVFFISPVWIYSIQPKSLGIYISNMCRFAQIFVQAFKGKRQEVCDSLTETSVLVVCVPSRWVHSLCLCTLHVFQFNPQISLCIFSIHHMKNTFSLRNSRCEENMYFLIKVRLVLDQWTQGVLI